MAQLFVALVNYIKPYEDIAKHLDAHRAYLKKGYESGFLLASGPRIPKDGGIIIGKFSSRTEAEAFAKDDPFTKNNLARYEFLTFEAVLHAEILKHFLRD